MCFQHRLPFAGLCVQQGHLTPWQWGGWWMGQRWVPGSCPEPGESRRLWGPSTLRGGEAGVRSVEERAQGCLLPTESAV